MQSLTDLGWGPFFESQLNGDTHLPTGQAGLRNGQSGLLPARVAEEQKGEYKVLCEVGPLRGILPGRLLYAAAGRGELPAVGDWVLVRPLAGEDRAVIERVLLRRTKLSRKEAGETTTEQVLAANVDTVFLIASLNQELNLRRIERYLSVIWESGARPVVVLNKSDLCEEPDARVREVEAIAPGVDVFRTSALTGDGLADVERYFAAGSTVVFVGSSGVGKSSLVNRLLETATQLVRGARAADDKGRHTTTSRQMIFLPAGGIVIDTPGLRELQIWDAAEGVGQAFADIEDIAMQCAFRDCRHGSEPGCALQQALEDGTLDFARLESYRKLQREQQFIAAKQDVGLRITERKRWKTVQKQNRQRMKFLGK